MAKIDFDKKFSGLSPENLKALLNAGRQDLDLAENKKQAAAAKKEKETNINKKGQPQAGILNSKEKNIMAKAKTETVPAGAKKTEVKPSPEPAKSKYEGVKNLTGDKEVDNFLNSAEFKEKEKKGGESGKEALAEWLTQKRMEKGQGVGEIDKEHKSFSEERRLAYEKWDWYRAEEILDKFGDDYADENFGQRPDKKAPEAPAAEPSKEVKNLDEKEKIITDKMGEGLAEMKEKTKSPEEFLKEAREKFVKALLDKEKADKTEGKLTGVRGWLGRHFGKKEVDPDKDSKEYWKNTVDQGAGDKASAVMEKNAATLDFEKARQELKDALQNYRNEKLEIEEQSLRNQGLDQKTIDKHLQKYAQELLTETTVKEAANIYDLKKGEMARGASADKSAWEWTKTVSLSTAQWYRKLKPRYKVLAAAGLFGGAMAAGSLGGFAAMAIGGCVITGRVAQRILGGMSATVGAEALMKRSQEKYHERKITKEMSGDVVRALLEKGGTLDDRMFEMLGRKNSEEKRRWVFSLALGACIGSGAAGQAYREAGHYAGIGGRYLFGLIPPGVKAAVAEHIDKIWKPQDFGAQYEQWKEQIAGHARRLKDEATPYYESAKDYADKVWSPWRDKVYSVLGIGQTGTGVLEAPDNYGAGAQSSLGGSSLGSGPSTSLGAGGGIKGIVGGAFNPDAVGPSTTLGAGGKVPSYFDIERPAAQGNLSGIDDELLANAKAGNIGNAPSYYDMERPAGSSNLSGADDELLANVKPAGPIDASLDKATHIGGPVPDTYDRISLDKATHVGSPVPEPYVESTGAGGGAIELDRATHAGSTAVPDTYDRPRGAGPAWIDDSDNQKGRGPAWVDDPENQKVITKAASGEGGINPEAGPAQASGVEIAKRNDSVWKMLDHQLQVRYGEEFTGLDAARRTYLVDAFKDKVAEDPGKFGLTNIDKVQLGKNYDFGSLFENKDVVQKQFEVAGALKEAAAKNILENNKTLEDWMASHKGQALTSEKVDEILGGGKGADLTEAVAGNSSGGKVFEAGLGETPSVVEGGGTDELTELIPTDESGRPFAGQGQGAPERLNALPENPPKDISGRIEEIFTANETANRDALGFRNAAEYKAVKDIKVGKLLEQVPANKDEAWAIYRREVPGRVVDLPSYGAIGPNSAKFGRLIELSKFIDSFKFGAGVKEMTVAQFLKMTGPEQVVRMEGM